jgi:hypothetical protein
MQGAADACTWLGSTDVRADGEEHDCAAADQACSTVNHEQVQQGDIGLHQCNVEKLGSGHHK